MTDREFYDFAYNFLLEEAAKKDPRITKEVVDKYLTVPEPKNNVKNLNDIFYKVLFHAQNAQGKPNIIGGAIGGVDNLGKVLFDFDATKVLNKYDGKETSLLQDIQEEFNLQNINTEFEGRRAGTWPKYCRTIIDAAKFVKQFKDKDCFFKFVNSYYEDDNKMAELPLVLSDKIYGLGFALSCDFLKELGFVNYGKPDVHLKEILAAYNYVSAKASDKDVLRKMIKITKNAEISCYKFDKVLWLIGSGFFYEDKFGKNEDGKIGSMKAAFIAKAPKAS